jgi:hypothetical protein
MATLKNYSYAYVGFQNWNNVFSREWYYIYSLIQIYKIDLGYRISIEQARGKKKLLSHFPKALKFNNYFDLGHVTTSAPLHPETISDSIVVVL